MPGQVFAFDASSVGLAGWVMITPDAVDYNPSVDRLQKLHFTGAVTATYDPTEQVYTEVNIPEQVQADWSVNDPDDLAYVKNRTHYEDISIETIVDNPTWDEIQDIGNGMLLCIAYMLPDAMPVEGGTYTVTHNGTTTTSTCFYVNDTDEAYWVIGNSALFDGEDNG